MAERSGNPTEPRKGMPSPRLGEVEFKARYRQHFFDPVFSPLAVEIARITDAAWDAYSNSRKSPVTRRAGAGYADPDYELSVDWIAAAEAVREAQRSYEDDRLTPRILIVNGS